jgi:hypothetical protein
MGRKLWLTARWVIIVNAIAGGAGIAQAETLGGVSVNTGVSAESNPYNEAGAHGTAVAATAEIRPRFRLAEENTTIDLSGLAQFRQFTKRYGLEDNYGVDARMVSRLSERFTLRGSGSFSYTENGLNSLGRPGLSIAPGSAAGAGSEVAPPFDLPPTDVTVLGRRTRTKTVQTGLGIDAVLTDRSQLSADVQARALQFDAATLSDYAVVDGQVRYNHSLNAFTSIGLVGSLSRTDYRAGRTGDALVSSGLVLFNTRFASRWTASVSAGLSSARTKQLPGQPNLQSTTLTVNGMVCRDGELSRLCISAERSPQPTANGSVRTSNTILADYNIRLSDRETFSLSGSYARTGHGQGLAAVTGPVKFTSAAARYDYRIGKKMSVFASGSYSRIFDSAPSRRANVGFLAGIQFDFGALK